MYTNLKCLGPDHSTFAGSASALPGHGMHTDPWASNDKKILTIERLAETEMLSRCRDAVRVVSIGA